MVLRSPLAIVALVLVSMPLMHLTQGSNPDVEGFIQRWDTDHDEAISRDELRNATGDRLDQLIGKMFHAIDKNHDGKLDKHELKTITGESLFWLFETRQRPAS